MTLELNMVHKGDCLELMKDIQKNSIDLIITDPPYKLNKTTGSVTSSSMSGKWQGNLKAGDKTANIMNTIKFEEWLKPLYEVAKEQAHFYVFVNDKNVQDMLNEATKVGFKLHNILVWKKNNKTPNRWYMKNCEFVLFFHKGKSYPIINKGSAQLLDYENISGVNKLHPTQKPLDLVTHLVENSSKKGQTVFDPFVGSGTTAVAALKTSRNFIGIEQDEKYVAIARQRISDAMQTEVSGGGSVG